MKERMTDLVQTKESNSEEKSEQTSEGDMKNREVALSAVSLRHFTKHVKIQDQNKGQIVQWKPWNYLLDLLDIVEKYDYIYILKASQLGITWEMCLFSLWVSLFSETSKILLFSQTQPDARELINKVSNVKVTDVKLWDWDDVVKELEKVYDLNGI